MLDCRSSGEHLAAFRAALTHVLVHADATNHHQAPTHSLWLAARRPCQEHLMAMITLHATQSNLGTFSVSGAGQLPSNVSQSVELELPQRATITCSVR